MKVEKIERIATHINVDSDASIGMCCELIVRNLYPNKSTTMFVPADTEKVPADTLAVDIKAKKHGKGKSYVGYYCRGILPYQICDEVDEQDSTGRSLSRVPLSLLPAALHAVGMTDLEIIQHMYPIVHGWIQLKIEWDAAKAIVDVMPKVKIGDYEFLVSIDNDSRGISSAGLRRGLDGTIFWDSEKTNGCGLSVYNKNVLNIEHLKLDGWYTDPRGFLFAWATRKAPKDKPPPQFKTVEAFIEYLKKQEVFYN